MSEPGERTYWRVGYHADPLGFVPIELCAWSYRFDDSQRRFRSIYTAREAETSIREVLADLRPNAAAIRRYVEAFGPEAAADVPARPVTASWRQQHVLIEARPLLDGPVVDLCDPDVRNEVERQHAELLVEHDLEHLDLSEITTTRRVITQTLAGDFHDRLRAAAVQFPSRLDGHSCIAVFEGRGELHPVGEPLALIDPAPEPLASVCAGWGLELAPVASLTEQSP